MLKKLSYKSHPEMFCKKGVPENFAKFTGKHLCHSLFLNKVAGIVRLTGVKNFYNFTHKRTQRVNIHTWISEYSAHAFAHLEWF